MPAVSKAQQKFMGMVHAAQKGEKPASAKVAKVAKKMKKKSAKDFASTKHKGLPYKVKQEILNRLIELRNSTKDMDTRTSIDNLIVDIETEIEEIEDIIKRAEDIPYEELEEIFLKEMLDNAFRNGSVGLA